LAGNCTGCFSKYDWNGGGWEAVWQNKVNPAAVELLNKHFADLATSKFRRSFKLEKSLSYAVCTSQD